MKTLSDLPNLYDQDRAALSLHPADPAAWADAIMNGLSLHHDADRDELLAYLQMFAAQVSTANASLEAEIARLRGALEPTPENVERVARAVESSETRWIGMDPGSPLFCRRVAETAINELRRDL